MVGARGASELTDTSKRLALTHSKDYCVAISKRVNLARVLDYTP